MTKEESMRAAGFAPLGEDCAGRASQIAWVNVQPAKGSVVPGQFHVGVALTGGGEVLLGGPFRREEAERVYAAVLAAAAEAARRGAGLFNGTGKGG